MSNLPENNKINYNFRIILFKNKSQKKVIKKFITRKKGDEFFDKLIKESNEVIFEKQYENGYYSEYEIAYIEKTPKNHTPIYLKDDYGRQVKINLDDNEYTISKIVKYKTEELFLDLSQNKKMNSKEFIKKYLNKPGLKLLSKLNNKIVLQNDDDLKLFTFKNEKDSLRFIDTISNLFFSEKKYDCMFVKDSSTAQRKYLYDLLVGRGYSKVYLHRQLTTHPTKK
jgi:hypothetical protein